MAMVLVKTNELSHAEWLEQRRKGIGGSDVAGILGLSPWSSPIKVYQDKIGEIPHIEENEAMYWGNVLEDVVAKEFQKRSGMKVRRRNAILQHPEYPYMLANVDRLIVGKREGLECKTTNAFMMNDWKEGEEIPIHYVIQCQWYMAITGYKKWHIAVLIGGNKFHMDVIHRDDELISMMMDRVKHFWEEHVLKGVPPAFDGSKASDELLKWMYPYSDEEKQIELSNSYVEDIQRHRELKEKEKELKTQIKEIENRIKGEMEDAEKAVAGEFEVTWRSFTSRRFDTKTFKKEHPDLYEKYVKESNQRRFTIK